MANRKTAIVTGASSGIGRETSILLAQEGYDLALVGRRQEELKKTIQLASDRASQDGEYAAIPSDLRNLNGIPMLIDIIRARFGRIDALANVAGMAPPIGTIEEVAPTTWQQCIDTNLSCVVHLTAAVLPIMRDQGNGIIVNVSSLASIDPFPGLAIYATAKAGLNMFTHCTAQQGAEIGVQAVAIAPGAVETPMLRGLFDTTEIPPAQTLSPTDVAKVIVDCITGRRTFEPGELIPLPSP